MTFPQITVPVTLVLRTPGTPDALGNDTFTETTRATRGVFAPGGSYEQVQGQDTLVLSPVLYLRAGEVVTHLDAVEIDGARYEVDGQPSTWTSPWVGFQFGVEVRLRRVLG